MEGMLRDERGQARFTTLLGFLHHLQFLDSRLPCPGAKCISQTA